MRWSGHRGVNLPPLESALSEKKMRAGDESSERQSRVVEPRREEEGIRELETPAANIAAHVPASAQEYLSLPLQMAASRV